MKNTTTIKCPNCQAEIDVNEIIYHQLEDELKQNYIKQQEKLHSEVKSKREEYKKAFNLLDAQKISMQEQKDKFEYKLKKATKKQIKIEKQKLHDKLKKELEDEQSESMALLKQELEKKSQQVKELNRSKAEIEKLKREKDEMESKIKADTEMALNQKFQEEKVKLQKLMQQESDLKSKVNDNNLKEIQKELEVARKKEQELKDKNILEQKKFQKIQEQKSKELKDESDRLNAQKISMQEQKNKFEDDLKKATKEQIKIEKQKLHDKLKKELEDEQSESMALLKQELEQKSQQVKELNRSKAEIEKLKREKNEIESKAKADAQIELNQQFALEKEIIKRAFEEENELSLRAKDEKIEQMRRDIDNARRKAEQGSMQVQGEALELAIEEWLSSQFAFDSVEEVKKGAFGADCVQIIHTREIQNCGVICYESKNTKAWSDGWLTKLKQDMLSVNADLGVLVTSVYPKDMRRMGFVDGIWVCSLDEFKGSSSLLRDSLIRVHKTIKKEENRSDKLSLLYDYMTGNEFSLQLRAITDGFIKMQEELDKEKRSLMASWKRRQKTIDGVLANTTEMYGSLQGIAGSSAIAHIEALELSEEIE